MNYNVFKYLSIISSFSNFHGFGVIYCYEEFFDKQFFFPKSYRKKMVVFQKILTEEKFDFYILLYDLNANSLKETLKELTNNYLTCYNSDFSEGLDIKMMPYNINPALQEDNHVISIRIKSSMWNQDLSCEQLFRREHAAQWYMYESENQTSMIEVKYHLGKAASYLRLHDDEKLNETVCFPEAAWEHYTRIRKLLKKPIRSENRFMSPSFDLITINEDISNQLYKIEIALTEQFRLVCLQSPLGIEKDDVIKIGNEQIDGSN